MNDSEIIETFPSKIDVSFRGKEVPRVAAIGPIADAIHDAEKTVKPLPYFTSRGIGAIGVAIGIAIGST